MIIGLTFVIAKSSPKATSTETLGFISFIGRDLTFLAVLMNLQISPNLSSNKLKENEDLCPDSTFRKKTSTRPLYGEFIKILMEVISNIAHETIQ